MLLLENMHSCQNVYFKFIIGYVMFGYVMWTLLELSKYSIDPSRLSIIVGYKYCHVLPYCHLTLANTVVSAYNY